jgi:5-methyltetrahydrofolate--homocysteine methyltransferase
VAYEIHVEAARIARAAADAAEAASPDRPALRGRLARTHEQDRLHLPGRGRSGRPLRHFRGAGRGVCRGGPRAARGGADLLMIETVFDVLNAKAAIFGIQGVFEELGVELPLWISGTITDASGRTLSGHTVEAFWNAIRHARPLIVGLNCALGAPSCGPTWRSSPAWPTRSWPRTPTPACPTSSAATTRRPRQWPRSVASSPGRHRQRRRRLLRDRPGARGGTRRRGSRPPPRVVPERPSALRLAGLEALNIGEGQPLHQHRRADQRGRLAGLRQADRRGRLRCRPGDRPNQVDGGAQAIDVNMDEAMLDSEASMTRFLNLVATEPAIARVPIVVDSSKWSVSRPGCAASAASRS